MTITRTPLKLGEIFGFPIFLEKTILLLIGVFLFFGYQEGLEAGASNARLFAVLILSVLWHELGHALMVRKLGLGESVILIGGLGGRTLYKGSPLPRQGILIALAGPGAGLLLGAFLLGILWILSPRLFIPPWLAEIWGLTVSINLYLNLANLIPILPLDGGQIVRFSLTKKLGDEKRALLVTSQIGLVLLTLSLFTLYTLFQPLPLFLLLVLLFLGMNNLQTYQALRRP